MRWQISSSACPARAARTRLAPSLAAARAVARPMPLDAPVITMTCWSRGLRSTARKRLLGVGTAAAEMPPPSRREKELQKAGKDKGTKLFVGAALCGRPGVGEIPCQTPPPRAATQGRPYKIPHSQVDGSLDARWRILVEESGTRL